jgi:hypothetical protein
MDRQHNGSRTSGKKQSTSTTQGLVYIRQGLTKLEHFSQWAENGKWTSWKSPHPPTHLLPLVSQLFHSLSGCAPVDTISCDERSRGNYEFTVKIDYQYLIT